MPVIFLTSVADLESRNGVRPGGKYHSTGHGDDSEDDGDYETISSGGMSDAKSRFTDYSLSSSVVPRNEGTVCTFTGVCTLFQDSYSACSL